MKQFCVCFLIFLFSLNVFAVNSNHLLPSVTMIRDALQPEENNHLDVLQELKSTLFTIYPQMERTECLQKRVEAMQQTFRKKIKDMHRENLGEKPLLSFVMPCYNRSSVLRESIDSIYHQHIPFPYEVIVVDDQSTDNSYEILLDYEKKYNNFFAFRNDKNLKAPSTRNVGIAYARGDYICNADSDDVFVPFTIESIFRGMVEKGYETAYFHELRFFLDRKSPILQGNISRSVIDQDEIALVPLVRKRFISPCAGNRIFSKRSWLQSGGYLEMPGHDSWAFSYKLLASGFKGFVLNGSGYLHRTWADHSNMWHDDARQNVHDISPKFAVLENPEFFSRSSFYLVENYPPKGTEFMDFLTENTNIDKLQFVPYIDGILEAYFYENTGRCLEAIDVYSKIFTQKEEIHPYLYLRAAYTGLRGGNRKFALGCLDSYIKLEKMKRN